MGDRHSDHVRPRRRRRFVGTGARATAIALAAWLVAGCEAPTKGFAGPGCYDYRGVLDAAVATEAECRALNMDWLTAPPPGMKRVQP
jgi:hypothetical protein